MPMFTFLEQYDLSGKTIVPFVTHGGGGVANCVSDLKKAVFPALQCWMHW